MSTVSVMISSSISDLQGVRAAVGDGLSTTGLANLVGMSPGSTGSQASSSYAATVDLAENCGAYVLILGSRYGYVSHADKSATQLEYEAAYRADPTKVLVLRQTGGRRDARQRQFIATVEDYHKGFFVSRFRTAEEAGLLAKEAFLDWIVDRAAVGRRLDYFDHFIRIASQRTPFPGARCLYRSTKDHVELTYEVLDQVYSVHFDKAQLFRDFWGSVFHLDERFAAWRADEFGRSSRH